MLYADLIQFFRKQQRASQNRHLVTWPGMRCTQRRTTPPVLCHGAPHEQQRLRFGAEGDGPPPARREIAGPSTYGPKWGNRKIDRTVFPLHHVPLRVSNLALCYLGRISRKDT
jgi:hypothetical protein